MPGKNSILASEGKQGDELIRLTDLVKIYDTGAIKVLGLNRINLTVRRGEFVAIMGHSGSGKSTLMNILGCLDRPTLGHYYLDGTDVAELSPNELSAIRNRKIGFVFQSFNLIARALANEPPLILADEPTGNLDTAASIEIMEIFAELHEAGATVVVVTHEDNIAAYTDRIIRFSDGCMISDEKNPEPTKRSGKQHISNLYGSLYRREEAANAD